GTWGLRKLLSADCCVVTDGALKFSGNSCPDGLDQVVLRDINIDCFETAWQKAQDAEQGLAVLIGEVQLIITAYNSGTKTITVRRASNDAAPSLIEFPEGTQICVGGCCDTCLGGPQADTYLQEATSPGNLARATHG